MKVDIVEQIHRGARKKVSDRGGIFSCDYLSFMGNYAMNIKLQHVNRIKMTKEPTVRNELTNDQS